MGGLLMVREGGQSYLPAYDAMGNIHAMIKASDGSIAAAYEYDAFGKTLRETGPYAADNPFRFSTKYTDTETSLVYYGLRYYSPSMGRFINRDPIEEAGGLNLYGFVGNNAVNRYDYLGMSATFGNGDNYFMNPRTGRMEHFDPQLGVFESDYYEGLLAAEHLAGIQAGLADQYLVEQMLMEMDDPFYTPTPVNEHAAIMAFNSGLQAWGDSIANTPAFPKQEAGKIGTYLVRQNVDTGKWDIVKPTDGVTTKHAFVNGIMGSLQDHADLGGKHFQAQPGGQSITEYTLFNNPSGGFLADIFETARDKLGFTTASARALAGVLQGIQNSGDNVSWIAHSQGGAIFAEAMSHAGGKLSANSVTFNAGANNAWVTNRIAKKAEVQVVGYNYSPWDLVPNVIGGNGTPITMIGSTLAAPMLWTNRSTHTAPTPSWGSH